MHQLFFTRKHQNRTNCNFKNRLPYMAEEISAILQFRSIFQSHQHPKKKKEKKVCNGNFEEQICCIAVRKYQHFHITKKKDLITKIFCRKSHFLLI